MNSKQLRLWAAWKAASCLSLVLLILGICLPAKGAQQFPSRPTRGNVSHDGLLIRKAALLNGGPTCTNTIQTTPLDSVVPDAIVGNNTPDDLVRAILGPGVTFFNVTFTGVTNSAGVFTDNAAVFGITNGIVLSSGSIDNIKGPNLAEDITQDNAAPGDPDLDILSAPYPTLDATVLEFDFVPSKNTVTFEYVFTSDEYNEWANTPFNDVFGFFVNGTNVAVLPVTTTGTNVVSVDNVNGGNPLGTDPQNSQFYVNNDIASGAPYCTEMDGFVVVLTATAPVQANQTNHIKLAIADGSDHILDSNVLIKGGSFSANHPPAAVCKNITVMGYGDCHAVIKPEDVDDGSGDLEDTGTVVLAVSPTELWGPGAHLVTLSVTDTNGAIGYCLATVTVVCFDISAITRENNDVRVTWACGRGKTNVLQASFGDGSGNYSNNFSDLSGRMILSNAPSVHVTNYLDVGAATNTRSRFYRVRLVP